MKVSLIATTFKLAVLYITSELCTIIYLLNILLGMNFTLNFSQVNDLPSVCEV